MNTRAHFKRKKETHERGDTREVGGKGRRRRGGGEIEGDGEEGIEGEGERGQKEGGKGDRRRGGREREGEWKGR